MMTELQSRGEDHFPLRLCLVTIIPPIAPVTPREPEAGFPPHPRLCWLRYARAKGIDGYRVFLFVCLP